MTGEEGEINKLLKPFVGNTAGGGMHVPTIFIGNDRKRLWTSAVGVFGAEELIKVIDHISNPLVEALNEQQLYGWPSVATRLAEPDAWVALRVATEGHPYS